ncbi:MAG: hypothetical protein ACI8UO_006276 [Verrucomicrobiales bacterium]|jgi:hypothetical protein
MGLIEHGWWGEYGLGIPVASLIVSVDGWSWAAVGSRVVEYGWRGTKYRQRGSEYDRRSAEYDRRAAEYERSVVVFG